MKFRAASQPRKPLGSRRWYFYNFVERGNSDLLQGDLRSALTVMQCGVNRPPSLHWGVIEPLVCEWLKLNGL
jgi:hypothetical protein